MIIERFEPIALRVERVGPFDEEYHLDLMKVVDPESLDLRPARLFLIASQNAKGKTTLLEAFALAMSLLDGRPRHLALAEDFIFRRGRIQLDIRVTALTENEGRVHIILSLSVNGNIYDYTPTELDTLNVTGGQEFIMTSATLDGLNFKGSVASQLHITAKRANQHPFSGLFNEDFSLPTLLFFTADRGISRPPSHDIAIAKPDNLGYSACHVFGREQGEWMNSLDNLLCWFAWLSKDGEESDSSYFKKSCELVNEFVINEPDKRLRLLSRDPPEPLIEANGQFHRLDRLSNGERARLQLFLRIASLMTSQTILLVDELELHLHPTWQHKILNSLIRLLSHYGGLRLYYTSHSKELVEKGFALSNSINLELMAGHALL